VQYDDELDSGLRELWATHESNAPSPSHVEEPDQYNDLEEIESPEAESSPPPPAPRPARGPRGEEEDRPRRRRRRRGRGRREEGAGPPPSAEPSRAHPAAGAEFDELLGDELLAEELPDELSDDEPRIAPPARRDSEGPSRPARSDRDDDRERVPGKRRRRRRRPASTELEKADVIDDLEDELDDPADVGYLSDSERGEGHKRIPTWDDAIGAIVAANIEARSSRPPSRREGRGRR
jgi:ribonuclease E